MSFLKNKKLSKKTSVILFIALTLTVFVTLFFALDGVNKTTRLYYGYKSRVILLAENKRLGKPLVALGFTNVEGGQPICQYIEKHGYTGKTLDCTAELTGYKTFTDSTSKARAIDAAQKLSIALNKNGWHQGNYEVGKWFKDVLGNVDYNPDAYSYKYSGNTFCTLDFFVAYSNPRPPAVNVKFRCTAPETHPPIY
ncbi:MAG TPA: hypothetical protein VNX65_00795 [Patescibacteria group bacterium]|jgi:hypothetical protein|nr:hypothetical protein [Patescibacteria group bacterium]